MNTQNAEREEWRDIKGYEGLYQISNFGNCRSLGRANIYKDNRVHVLNGKNLKSYIRGKYSCVMLYKNKLGKNFYLHVLVIENFIGNKPFGKQVNHIDGNKNNNRIDNLEYITPSENMFHSSKLGLAVTGERHYCHKLTESKVIEIRKRYKEGNVTVRALAREYGVTQRTMQQVIEKSTWRFIKRAGGE